MKIMTVRGRKGRNMVRQNYIDEWDVVNLF